MRLKHVTTIIVQFKQNELCVELATIVGNIVYVYKYGQGLGSIGLPARISDNSLN